MGGRYKSARRKPEAVRRGPSVFFIIAIAIGLGILAWAAVYSIRNPQKPAVPATTTTTTTSLLYFTA